MAQPEIEHGFVDLGADRLHFARTRPADAAGPTLLICNGIGASTELLEPLMLALTGVETLAFDLPGIGASKPSFFPRRLPSLAQLTRKLIDALEIERVDVMGISWGGGLAQQFARQYPRRTQRLILAATSTGHLMIPPRPSVILKMATPLRYFSAGYFKAVAGSIYGGDFRSNGELAEQHVRRMAPPTIWGYAHQLFALAGWTSLHWLRELEQPTLILAGDDDPIIPMINARILAGLIPNAELEVFDCGHLFMLTRLQETTQRIEGFLQS